MTSLTAPRGEGLGRFDHALVELPFLAEREKQVISARLGLDRGAPRSCTETARMVHTSRDAVRRVEIIVGCKLRHPSAGAWEPKVSRLRDALHGLS
ncbi:MAG TPA: hypothetical protein VFA11_04545 [Acidimicrobiales bacterium]|nr:hypothetical protein [Acidimicrobiales bacterium]